MEVEPPFPTVARRQRTSLGRPRGVAISMGFSQWTWMVALIHGCGAQ
jgi:hypothetical protein